VRSAEDHEDRSDSPAAPTGADGSPRHLTAVGRQGLFLDRRSQPFVPVYLEFVTSPKSDRPGYGLSGSVAVFYSVLLYLTGTPADGRRQSRGEMEHKDRFVKRSPSAGGLSKTYGWTYDQIDSWSRACAAPRSCPHCQRAHPLLRIERRNGKKNTYVIVRCQDVSDDDCLPTALVDRAKRPPTGAADPKTRTLRDDPRVGLPGFDGLLTPAPPMADLAAAAIKTVGERPKVSASNADAGIAPAAGAAAGLAGQTPFNGAQTVGQSPRVGSRVDNTGASAIAGRTRVLEGFAIIERVSVPQEAVAAIAAIVEEPADLYSSLIAVLAAASIEHCAITADFASAILAQRRVAQAQLEPSKDIARAGTTSPTIDWATQRIYELAVKREKNTTLGRARAYHAEFYEHCLAHTGGDPVKAESELARVLTDPRCCGYMGKEPPTKPIAMIRSGFRDGWIWIDAASDDGSGQLARAFERSLSLERQAEVERIFRANAAGEPLDYGRLREHRITSRSMITYLHRRFGTRPPATSALRPPD
jgi:hypothetical protein